VSHGTVVESDALGRGNRQAGLGQQAQVGLKVCKTYLLLPLIRLLLILIDKDASSVRPFFVLMNTRHSANCTKDGY